MNSSFKNLKNDLPASLVVFLVALPLCLGIALASGAPLFSGIIAGFIGGIVVGSLSGSSLGVSGPAAGLVAIVLPAIQQFGYEAFLLAVVLAGALQIVLGIARAGIIAYYFPNAVIKGMLSGIGIIIILKQIPHAFGYDADPEGDMSFIQPDGQTTLSELSVMVDYITPGAVLIAFVSLAILILWEQPFTKKYGFFKVVPGALFAVIAGILINVLEGNQGYWALTHEHEVDIPVAASLSGFLSQFTLPDFSQIGNTELYVVAVTIAIVASLETLLCVEATDKLDPQKRVTPTNRELYAQGTGNMLSGLIGGLPVTQVIVRSSANIQTGGKTKLSAILHGVLLLASIMVIPQVLNLIPLASLAAILLVVGYKLAKPSLFKEMLRKGPGQYIPFFVTILGLIFTDLLIGVGLGLVVGIMHILWNNFKTPYHFDPNSYEVGKPVTIEMSQEVTFLNKASIQQTLNNMPEGTHLILDIKNTKYMHPDVLEIIDDFELGAPNRNIKFEVVGRGNRFDENPQAKLEKVVIED